METLIKLITEQQNTLEEVKNALLKYQDLVEKIQHYTESLGATPHSSITANAKRKATMTEKWRQRKQEKSPHTTTEDSITTTEVDQSKEQK